MLAKLLVAVLAIAHTAEVGLGGSIIHTAIILEFAV
jgi:hypothetical protein